jgi:hypothetical protein
VRGATDARNAAKLIQAKPNKTKQKSLRFLGFLWPNWGFSMGYGESKEKSLSFCSGHGADPLSGAVEFRDLEEVA